MLIISAVSMDGVIGNSSSNKMPWHLSKDLKWFKEHTLGKTVVMGSRTFNSIGKLLPGRTNVIMTRNEQLKEQLIKQGAEVCANLEDLVLRKRTQLAIIGGRTLYEEAFKYEPEKLLLTVVQRVDGKPIEGDVKFPFSGERFLDNFAKINGMTYACIMRSDWEIEGDFKFCFSEFVKLM